jgi:hypothetical protein
MQSQEKRPLLPGGLAAQQPPASTGSTNPDYSNYNPGPRKATDKIFGGVFVAFIMTFVIWSSVRIGGAGVDNSLFMWEYNTNEWAPPTIGAQGAACTRISAPPTSPPTAAPTTGGGGQAGTCEETFIIMILTPLMIGLLGGVGGGAAIILGFKYKPYHLTYTAVVVQVIMPSAVAIFLMVRSKNSNVDTDAYDGSDDAFTYPAYFLFGVSLLLALMYFWMRESLKLVAELLKHSSAVLRDNMCLIPVKAVFCVVFTVFYVALVAMVVVSFMTMQVVLDVDPTVPAGSLSCMPEVVWDGSTQGYTGLFVVVLGWFAFWSLETRNYIIGDVAAHWYYHGQQGGDIGRATKHAFCSHFGSLAFAGLATWFIEQLKRSARNTGGNPISCLCSLVARCLLSYVEYLFKMATLMVAITGKPFGASGMDVGRLFWASFGNMYHSTGVWFLPDRILGALSFIMSLTFGAAYGISQYYWARAECRNGTLACVTDAWTSADGKDQMCDAFSMAFAIGGGSIVFLVMLFPLHFLCKMLTVIVDTSFLCFLMDKRDGVVTQPAFHGVFGQVLAHKNKTDAKKMEAASKNATPPAYLAGVPPGYAVAQAEPPQYGTAPPSYQTTEA